MSSYLSASNVNMHRVTITGIAAPCCQCLLFLKGIYIHVVCIGHAYSLACLMACHDLSGILVSWSVQSQRHIHHVTSRTEVMRPCIVAVRFQPTFPYALCFSSANQCNSYSLSRVLTSCLFFVNFRLKSLIRTFSPLKLSQRHGRLVRSNDAIRRPPNLHEIDLVSAAHQPCMLSCMSHGLLP